MMVHSEKDSSNDSMRTSPPAECACSIITNTSTNIDSSSKSNSFNRNKRSATSTLCTSTMRIVVLLSAICWVDAFVPSTSSGGPSRPAVEASWASPSSTSSSSTSATALFGVRSSLKRKLASSRIVKHLVQYRQQHYQKNKHHHHHHEHQQTHIHHSDADSAPKGKPPIVEPTMAVGDKPFTQVTAAVAVHGSNDFDSLTLVEVSPDLQIPATEIRMHNNSDSNGSNNDSLQQQQQQQQAPQTQAQRHLVPIETNSANIQRAKTAASSTTSEQQDNGQNNQKHLESSSLIPFPLNRKRDLTSLEHEFYGMVNDFAAYTEADILSVADPQKRAIVEGVVANAHSQPIYRAFEILYEDLLPLRMAGRLIFSRLKDFMAQSIRQRELDVQSVIDATGLDQDVREIQEIRLMFVSTASLLNHDNYLSLEQLAETGMITSAATEVLGFDSAEQLLHRLDTERTGKLNFVQLMNGLWSCATDICGIENCNPRAVLHNLLVELDEKAPTSGTSSVSTANMASNPSSSRTQRFVNRYNEMVASFIEWKDLMPPPPDTEHGDHPESRRMEVVRGCFVGAENEKVVDALRICYVEYAGLRIAGDVIFKLVSSVLNNKKSKHQGKQQSSQQEGSSR